MTLPAQATLLRHEGDKTWLELTIREGRNQQIRRMGEATHFPVMRLARTSFAGITSEALRPGAWRALTRDELVALKKEYGVPKRIPAPIDDAAGLGPGRRARRQPAHERGPSDRARREQWRAPGAERPPRGGEPGDASSGDEHTAERRHPSRRAEGQRPRERSTDGARAGARPSSRAGAARDAGDVSRERTSGGEGRRGRGKDARPVPERSGERVASRGDTRSRERGAGGGGREREERGARGSFAGESSPRYGGGSPGRRPYDVREDWGGGAGRGRTGSDREAAGDAFRGAPRRGASDSAGGDRDNTRPRGELGGRGGASRTTGTGGGIGATRDDDYRMRRRRR
jgi:23S rRNA pseudouridine2605 synthase